MNAFTVPILAAVSWAALWWTPDQLGARRMQQERYPEAAEAFEDPLWKGSACFRAGEFEAAEKNFARLRTPESLYNRGLCKIMLGQYDAAVALLDDALAMKPDWENAQINRQIAMARAKATESKGGEMGDQKIGADEIRLNAEKTEGGQETQSEETKELSAQEMQALWLRRVESEPADFLKAKFAYQNAVGGKP